MRRAALLLPLVALLGCDDRSVPWPQVDDRPDEPMLQELVGLATWYDWSDAARRQDQLARTRSLGISQARFTFPWAALEPRPNVWKLGPLDQVVADATDAGVTLTAVCGFGNPAYPSEASDGGTGANIDGDPADYFPPIDAIHFTRYVEKVVGRYGDTVRDWEIWNEPNIGFRFWRPAPDAARYGRLALEAARAGKAICPGCRFSAGGLSMPQPIPQIELYPPGQSFLKETLAAVPELGGAVDAFAFHPYQYPKDAPEHETAPFPSRRQGSLATQTRKIASQVTRPLWITENGWSTNPGIPRSDAEVARVFRLDDASVISLGREAIGPTDFEKLLETLRGVSERDQARYLVRSTLISAQLGVRKVMLYTLDDFDFEADINQEAAFGLYRVDGSEKDAARAVRTMMTRFGAYHVVGDVSAALGLEEPSRALLLRDGERETLALWRWRDGEQSVRIGRLPHDATVINLLGASVRTVRKGGAVEVSLGPDVVWVEL